MKIFLFGATVSVLLLAAISVSARQLSVREATALAEEFASKNMAKNDVSRSVADEMKLVYSATMPDAAVDETAYYVFDRGTDGGYVIVSGDDRLRPVLGYAAQGRFDEDSIPPNMRWWLGEYAREIAAFLCGPSESGAVLTREPVSSGSAGRSEVAPLVTTKWNQTTPYNDQCPSFRGRKSVTGCVATAMAQIVNYHNWPQGTGSGMYSYTLVGLTSKVQFNYGTTTFAWANMLDDYSVGNPGFSQKMAVANLMLACGVGVHMKYSPDESGAFTLAVPYALINYFKYDGAARMLMRDYYYTSEWEDIVYGEIAAGRPVLYSGANEEGAGHAFVCDGYGADGLFHINWGWGGYYDDYFALSALDPEGQGTGGNIGGFNYGQDVIIGIKPASGTAKNNGCILSGGAFIYDDNKFKTSDGMFNYYPQAFKGEAGVEVVKADAGGTGTFITVGPMDWGAANIVTGNLPGYNVAWPVSIVSGLQPGNYNVYPAWKGMAGRWERMLCPVSEQCFVTLTVTSDGQYVYSNEGPVTGVTDIVADDGFKVYGQASSVVVAGAAAGGMVEVYDLRGVLVARTKASPDDTVISLAPGIYVVRCGTRSKKVSVGGR